MLGSPEMGRVIQFPHGREGSDGAGSKAEMSDKEYYIEQAARLIAMGALEMTKEVNGSPRPHEKVGLDASSNAEAMWEHPDDHFSGVIAEAKNAFEIPDDDMPRVLKIARETYDKEGMRIREAGGVWNVRDGGDSSARQEAV